MKAFTAQQIAELDRLAIEDYGVPSLALMENAGRAVAQDVLDALSAGDQPAPAVTVICGAGNNGGDGLVTARHLWNAGVDVRLFLAAPSEKLKPDARVHCEILRRCGYPYREIRAVDRALEQALVSSEGIVDALFGVGLTRPVTGFLAELIEAVKASRRPVTACDIPSGLDATTGEVLGACVRARRTVTFTAAKTGLLVKQGPECAGEVAVVDIGIPGRLVDQLKTG